VALTPRPPVEGQRLQFVEGKSLAGERGPDDAGGSGELDWVVYRAVSGLCESGGASLRGPGFGAVNGETR
jgi:hypothetical protein